MDRDLEEDEREAFLDAFGEDATALKDEADPQKIGYVSLRADKGWRRWKLQFVKKHFLLTAQLPTEHFHKRSIQALSRVPEALLVRKSKGLTLLSAPTWLNTQGLEDITGEYWGFSIHEVPEAFDYYPPEFLLGKMTHPVVSPTKLQKGAFRPEQHEMRVVFNEKQRKLLQNSQGRLFLRRCADASSIIQGRESASVRQVVLCFSGDLSEYDTRFQRVSQTLVYAFERFSKKQWKLEAEKLIAQTDAVAAFLPLKESALSPYKVGGIFETLVVDSTVKSLIQQVIEQANFPKDCLAPLARLVIAHAMGFEERLQQTARELDLDEATVARVQEMECEWKERWAAPS